MLTVPLNLSEGRDRALVGEIVATAQGAVLDVHSDPDHNRSVITIGGAGSADAARSITLRGVQMLDISAHGGAHPRLGVIDVVPFVPLGDESFEAAISARDGFARWAAEELDVPVFVYGPERSLPEVRREAFLKMSPQHGRLDAHPTAGAICAGARLPLVAWNAWLSQPDIRLASAIARRLRRLDGVRSLALALGDSVQVSCNLVDPRSTPPHVVYDAIAEEASVERCELVGLIPEAVLERVPEDRWEQLDLGTERTLEWRLRALGG